MITVTDAIKYAREYANDFYQGEDIKNLGLEEVVFDDEANEWRITLGYDSHRVKIIETAPNTYSAISKFALNYIEKETLREYKTFRMAAEDGGFKSMLIRIVG